MPLKLPLTLTRLSRWKGRGAWISLRRSLCLCRLRWHSRQIFSVLVCKASPWRDWETLQCVHVLHMLRTDTNNTMIKPRQKHVLTRCQLQLSHLGEVGLKENMQLKYGLNKIATTDWKMNVASQCDKKLEYRRSLYDSRMRALRIGLDILTSIDSWFKLWVHCTPVFQDMVEMTKRIESVWGKRPTRCAFDKRVNDLYNILLLPQ